MKSIYISGYKQKQLSINILSHILNFSGENIATASPLGINVNGLKIKNKKTSLRTAKKILNSSTVDTVIFEIRPRHLFKNHLNYDKCTLAAITNIDITNMSKSPLNSLDLIFQTFSLLLSLSKTKIVINADDKYCQQFIKLKGHKHFILVSLNNSNPFLKYHIEKGEEAAVIEDNEFVFYNKNKPIKIATINDFNQQLNKSRDEKILFYTLFSMSCCYALGVSPVTIRQSLRVLKTSYPVQLTVRNDYPNKIFIFNSNDIDSNKYLPFFIKKTENPNKCIFVCSSAYYQKQDDLNSLLDKFKKIIFSDNNNGQHGKRIIFQNEFLAINNALKQSTQDDYIIMVSDDYFHFKKNINPQVFKQALKYYPFINIVQKNKNRFSLMFLGDTGFGENYQENIARRGGENILTANGYKYPLAKMKKTLTHADMVFANLETPLTSLKKSPFADKKSWVHRGDVIKTPDTLKQHNIHYVTLANNHTYDYGVEGFTETLNTLEQSGIEYVGAGKNSIDASKPLLINLTSNNVTEKIAIIGAYHWSKNNEKKFDLYANDNKGGINALTVQNMSEQIKTIRKLDPDIFIILSLHWGKNYEWVSDSQREIAKKLLSEGKSDLILSHGAHMVQEFEKIGDKWSVYSIGNFMFNSPGRYKKLKVPPYSFLANLIFEEGAGHFNKHLELYPIVTDNRKTKYQSRFVLKHEFNELSMLLEEKNNQTLVSKSKIQDGGEKFYYLLEI